MSDSKEIIEQKISTRNILIHGYDKIDETIIFGILKKHLEDFYKYLSEIKRNYLEKT